MEYLGRLGLVPRKSKKDRETSPQKRRRGEESRALKTDLTRAIESGLTSTKVADFPRPAATIVDIARLPMPSDCSPRTTTTAASLDFPATPSCAPAGQDAAAFADDMDYFHYEQHVHAQARARAALFGAPGGRHAWKTLIFWKRRRTAPVRPASLVPIPIPLVSASSTPRSHYHAGLRTPSRKASGCRNSSPALPPLYCSDDFASTMSIRAWYEPMLRRGKLGALQDDENCNRSPYVPLSSRRPSRMASPGPLYLV